MRIHLMGIHLMQIHLMRIHLMQNSTSVILGKSPKIHLVQPIIHLMRILPIIRVVQKFALCE